MPRRPGTGEGVSVVVVVVVVVEGAGGVEGASGGRANGLEAARASV